MVDKAIKMIKNVGNQIIKDHYLKKNKWYKVEFYIKNKTKGCFDVDAFLIKEDHGKHI